MKRAAILILFFSVLLSNRLPAQDLLPSYIEVAKEFFTNYSRDSAVRIFFAKKKQGWYVRAVDAIHWDSIKSDQLFWDVNERKYKPLNGFEPGISEEEAVKKIAEVLKGNDAVYYYGFERCRYFGYDDWDIDMIKDFGDNIPQNDTLLEGLARAYGGYGPRYLTYATKTTRNDPDPLKKKLYKVERPGKEQVDQFLFYVNKAINCNRVLSERNPGYKMLVGTSGMKFVNEKFYQYQQLTTYGYTKEATEILNTIPKDDIYHQIGLVYLNSCPPNSILITYGDNDTYAAWYVQEKEGIRKDVTILNYQLLSTMPYLDMLRKTKKVAFSLPGDFFTKTSMEYASYFDEPGQPAEISQPLRTLIDHLYNVDYPYNYYGDTVASYKTKTAILDVDLARLKKICDQTNLARSMDFQLNDYMFLADLVILDILDKNIYTRPVCATARLELIQERYLQHEGSVYRILPLDDNSPDKKLKTEAQKIENFLLKNYKPVIVSYGKKLNERQDICNGLHTSLFSELINDYLSLKNSAKAMEWAKKYVGHPGMQTLSPDIGDVRIVDALLKTGYTKEPKVLAERLAQKLVNNYNHYSSLELFQSKEDLSNWLNYLKSSLNEKKITSAALQKMIDDLDD